MKEFEKIFNGIFNDIKTKHRLDEELIEKARESIKHPHFYYAEVDTERKTITFKRKKWYQWFSGKRIVAVKIIPIQLDGLGCWGDKEPLEFRNDKGKFIL